jgi:hypothetical protein
VALGIGGVFAGVAKNNASDHFSPSRWAKPIRVVNIPSLRLKYGSIKKRVPRASVGFKSAGPLDPKSAFEKNAQRHVGMGQPIFILVLNVLFDLELTIGCGLLTAWLMGPM